MAGVGGLPFATNGRLFALVYLMLKTSLGIYGLNKHAIGQKKEEEERTKDRQTVRDRPGERERDGEKKGTNHFVIASVMKSADMSHQDIFLCNFIFVSSRNYNRLVFLFLHQGLLFSVTLSSFFS